MRRYYKSSKQRKRRDPIRVCRYCLQEIEYSCGKQHKLQVWTDPHDDKNNRCEWCKESGNDSLYELLDF